MTKIIIFVPFLISDSHGIVIIGITCCLSELCVNALLIHACLLLCLNVDPSCSDLQIGDLCFIHVYIFPNCYW